MKRAGTVAVVILCGLLLGSLLSVTATGQQYFARAIAAVAGPMLFSPDNTHDIGASGANRPNDIFAGGTIRAPVIFGTLTGVGTGSQIGGASDGVISLTNAAATDFTRLQFGGTTSSFPAWARTGAVLIASLADGSGYARVNMADASVVNADIVFGSGTGIAVQASGLVRRVVYKVIISSPAFITAGLTSDITLATLPAKTALVGVYGEMTQYFACTATCTSSTLSATVGTATGGAQVLASWDMDATTTSLGSVDAQLGTSMTRAGAIQGGVMPAFGGTNIISMRLTSGTGNIGTGAATNLSQGSVTFYLITERLP
jgi:hypothetical protein